MVEDAFNFVKWLHEIQETKTEMIYFCGQHDKSKLVYDLNCGNKTAKMVVTRWEGPQHNVITSGMGELTNSPQNH